MALIPVKHPSVNFAYPPGTIVQIKSTHEFARIVQPVFLMDGVSFTHYLAEIEGRDNSKGLWALYHDNLELEVLPE